MDDKIKRFLKKVPLVSDMFGNLKPEIRISKETVLCIDYPINIFSPGLGLTHMGVGGSFNYYFIKDRKRYCLLFVKDSMILKEFNNLSQIERVDSYGYVDILNAIKEHNEDKSVLY
jgi:hypothetical protein